MNESQRKLLFLFEQPSEPLDKPRDHGSVLFSFDGKEHVTSTRFGKPPTTIFKVPERPDAAPSQLGSATSIPRGAVLSIFLDHHRQAAKDLSDAFMKTKGVDDLMHLAARVRDNVNEDLFNYALSLTILQKKELRTIRLPSLLEVFPDKFLPEDKIMGAYIQAMNIEPDKDETLKIKHSPDFASTTQKPEHRVSYWREDYGINTHHWHWHIAYPLGMGANRDRKGELFYYMHQQMLARYDMERLSVGLNRVEALENWRVPISDGYFPKLTINNSGRAWGTRQDDTLLKDVRRSDFGSDFLHITDLETWRSRLYDAIHQGFMIDRNGERISLSDVSTSKRGIEILGDAIEADNRLSVNYPYYGNLHNIGHVFISVAHDHDHAHKEEGGVMSSTATAMRDPVFYRWHKFVDNIFQEYKLRQPPYTEEDLSFPDVVIDNASVVREGNTGLTTGWNMREFEASRGLDFNSPVPVVLQLTHMDHDPFDYHLQVTNNNEGAKLATVRIFLAPKLNIRGLENTFLEQRLLWAEMDKFTIKLKKGMNHIVRPSKDSSVTSLPELTFRDLEKETGSRQEFSYCGCGWPQHLLLPRGKPEGMDFQMFFMITDWQKDKVENIEDSAKSCASAVSFCGIADAKYPDSRPMGFPFDRRPPPQLMDQTPNTVGLAKLDNIKLLDVKITFLNKNFKDQAAGDSQ